MRLESMSRSDIENVLRTVHPQYRTAVHRGKALRIELVAQGKRARSLSSTTEQAPLTPPMITRICKRSCIRPYAGEFPRHVAFLLSAVEVTEALEDEQGLSQRFNESLVSSESLMPERPHHFHVGQIHLISGALCDSFCPLKPKPG